jgi:hypothetical protein
MYRLCTCDSLPGQPPCTGDPFMSGLNGGELERPSTYARRERGRLRIIGGLRCVS